MSLGMVMEWDNLSDNGKHCMQSNKSAIRVTAPDGECLEWIQKAAREKWAIRIDSLIYFSRRMKKKLSSYLDVDAQVHR